jgi:hypothetical protein
MSCQQLIVVPVRPTLEALPHLMLKMTASQMLGTLGQGQA